MNPPPTASRLSRLSEFVNDAICPMCGHVASGIAYSPTRKRADAAADGMLDHLFWRHDEHSTRTGHE